MYNIRTDLGEMRENLAQTESDLASSKISLMGQSTALSEDFIDAQTGYGGLSGLDEEHWMNNLWASILGHEAMEGAY